MKTFKDYIFDEFGISYPSGPVISGEWFRKNHLPMIVQCSCCEMTMSSPSAFVDDEGRVFCGNCADYN